MRIRLREWEMACCGEPIRVGDEVRYRFTVIEEPMPGQNDAPPAEGVRGLIEVHCLPDGVPTGEVHGRVTALWEVRAGSPRRDAQPAGREATPVDVIAPVGWDADRRTRRMVPKGTSSRSTRGTDDGPPPNESGRAACAERA